jgi:hypothetical protein
MATEHWEKELSRGKGKTEWEDALIKHKIIDAPEIEETGSYNLFVCDTGMAIVFWLG